MTRVAVIVLGLLAATLVVALPSSRVINPLQVIRRGPPKKLGPARAHTTQFFTQRLDHFDVLNNATWQQRYFISTDAYIPGAPIFLLLAGEWEADPVEIEFTFISQLAANFSGITIDLEHRYYGQSRPTPDTSLENLKYLSVDQALEDAATFALSLKESLGLNGPWIVIGESYSANLAAWARARYPHIFLGAYASSAPILAQLGIPEYMEVVNKALVATDPACPAVIQVSTDELDALILNGDAERITQLFNLASTIDLANKYDLMLLRFYISLIVFGQEVQYAVPGSLAIVCETLVAGQSTPLETVAQFFRDTFNGTQVNIDTNDLFSYYRNDTQFSDDVNRPWLYHSAIELGYYQSLASPNQPFGQNMTEELFLRFNAEVYGPEFTRELTQSGIDRTNLAFGGLNPDVTRVIFTHGTLDPWHALGRQTDLNPDSPVIMIEGLSHCYDTVGVPSSDDPQQLIDARMRIIEIVASWL